MDTGQAQAGQDDPVAEDLYDIGSIATVLQMLKRARFIRSIQVINGLTPGLLRRAVEGEHVGTIITAD